MSLDGRPSQPRRVATIFSGLIDPKETEYRGILMRSRLEADFAYHLDKLGLAWTYEPRTFGQVGEGYRPDFEIFREDGHHYVEVKPTLAEVVEAKRRMLVIRETYPDAVLVVACAEGSRWFGSVEGETWIHWVNRWAHQ